MGYEKDLTCVLVESLKETFFAKYLAKMIDIWSANGWEFSELIRYINLHIQEVRKS